MNSIIQLDLKNIQEWLKQVLSLLPQNKIRCKFYMNQKEFNVAQVSVLELLQKCVSNAKGNLKSAIDEYLGVNFVKLMTTQ